MGKKRHRKSMKSKGIHSSVRKGIVRAVREDRNPYDIHFNKLDAWKKGLNPWLTVENPLKATNARYIRVRANEYFGDPKAVFLIGKKQGEEEV